MSTTLTNDQITAGAAVLGDNGQPLGRNTAIMAFDAMTTAPAGTATAAAAMNYSAEQAARALLDRMGVPNAQEYSSGDLVELANLIATSGRIVVGNSPDLRELARYFNVSATTGRPLTLPASSCALLLAAMTTGTAKNATGETDREMALRFKREADALWHRVHAAEQNAARYLAWRDAMLVQDQKFIDAMALALPAAVGHSREPTADEWDAAVDKAAALPVLAAQEDRTVVLLKAAHALLKKQAFAGHVINVLSETVHYDGTDCDGLCLISDIEDELGIDGDARPA